MENISKLEAAKRQLDTAIRLFFDNKDEVSIHTLTTAAYGILVDIARKEDEEPFLDLDISYIKREKRGIFIKKLRQAQNFFKHADKDGKVILNFNSKLTVYLMLDAVHLYHILSEEHVPITMVAFIGWYAIRYPHFVNDKFRKEIEAKVGKFSSSNKTVFAEAIRMFEKKGNHLL